MLPSAPRHPTLWGAFILSVTFSMSSCGNPPTSDPPNVQRLYEGDIVYPRLAELLPPDAADYVDRYRHCLHWSTEPAEHPERAAEVEQGIEVSCTGIEAQRDSVRAKYPTGSSVAITMERIIAQIDSGSYAFMLDDPENRSPVLNQYYEARAQELPEQVDNLIADRQKVANGRDPRLRTLVELKTQALTRNLAEVMANNDRLHPKTAKDLRLAQRKWQRATHSK